MSDEASLFRRFAESHAPEVFAEIVRRHLDAVYSTALRRVGGDTHLAEDVVQQVFVALARSATVVARHPAPAAWLYLATRHEAAHLVRRERRRQQREQTAFAMTELDSAHPDPVVDWTRLSPVIDAAIDTLGTRDRTAIILRFIDGRTFAEVGTALNVSDDAARMRVDRALDKLRHTLARRGLTSTSAALSLALAQHATAAAPAGLAAGVTGGALAAAGAVGTSAVGLLSAMSTAKITTAIVGSALLLAILGTATYEVHRQLSAEAALATARQEDAALADRLRTLHSQTAATKREAAVLQQQLRDRLAAQTAAASVSASALTPASAPAARRDLVVDGKAFMTRHPAVRQALIDFFNAQTNYQWSGFYKAAHLTPAQIAEFQFLMRPRTGGYSQQMGPGQPDLQLSLDDGLSNEEIEARRQALLGPDGMREFSEYARTMPARQLGAQLASTLAFTATPLVSIQFEQFAQSIATNGGVKITHQGTQYDWAAINAAAEKILSPEQRSALAGLQAQSDFEQAYSQACIAIKTQSSQNSAEAPTP